MNEVLWRGPYIPPDTAAEPIRCIVDLGAHIGFATLAFKARFPEAEIHGYEPDPDNFELLRHNTMDLPGVVLHREAVGVSQTETTLYIPDGRHSASSLCPPLNAKQVRAVLCQVKPLDEILAEIGRQVDLVKFDIEGMEYKVFAASRLIHRVRWIVGELKGGRADVERFVTLFPHHDALVRWQTPKMAYVHMRCQE